MSGSYTMPSAFLSPQNTLLSQEIGGGLAQANVQNQLLQNQAAQQDLADRATLRSQAAGLATNDPNAVANAAVLPGIGGVNTVNAMTTRGQLALQQQELAFKMAQIKGAQTAMDSVYPGPGGGSSSAPTQGGPPIGQGGPSDTFEHQMGSAESGNNPAAQNKAGYIGEAQFGASRLADIGMYQPAPGEDVKANQWTGTFEIPGFPQVKTKADFLASPAAQHAAFLGHVANVDTAIAQTPGADQFDPNGLRAVAHLGGNDGMRKFVASGGRFNPSDSNGTSLSNYYQRFAAGGVPALKQAFAPPSFPAGPPVATTAPGQRIAVGDSLGVGIGQAGSMPTYAVQGAGPQAVLANIKAMPDAQVAGKDVMLSSGASNNPGDVGYVQQQIAELQRKGARSVTVVGVGTRKDYADNGVNTSLANAAQMGGAQYQPLDPAALGPDGVHPTAAGYATLARGGAQTAQGGVAARTGGVNVAGPGAPTGQPQGAPQGQPPQAAAAPPAPPQTAPQEPQAAEPPATQPEIQQVAQRPVVDANGLTAADNQALLRIKQGLQATMNPNGAQLLQAEIEKRQALNRTLGAWQKQPDGSITNVVTGEPKFPPTPRLMNQPGVGLVEALPGGETRVVSAMNPGGIATQAAATAQGTGTGTATATQVPKLMDLGRNADTAIGNIDYGMSQLHQASAGGIPTGYFAPWLAEAAAAGKSLGVNLSALGIDPQAVGNVQSAQKTLAVVSGAILQQAIGKDSQITDAKIEHFIHAQPGIETDPQAVQRVLNWARSQFVYEREMAMEGMKTASEPGAGGMLPLGWQAGYYAKKGAFAPIYDPMTREMEQPAGEGPSPRPPAPAQTGAGPPVVKTLEDYNKLPPGPYVAPDGHTRRKS